MIGFFDVICMSAPHIYHSALPLSPKMSIVYGLYKQYAHPFLRVVQGLPAMWEPVAAILYCNHYCSHIRWSPCNKFVAHNRAEAVEILDAVTLQQLNTLKLPEDFDCEMFIFSPDSQFLTGFSEQYLISWDLQTGGPIGTILLGPDQGFGYPYSSTYSVDGKVVAVAYKQKSKETSAVTNFIATYDLLSKMCTHSYHISGKIIYPIWTHNECFQFATIRPGCITIWEVAFTGGHLSEVEILPAPNEIAGGEEFVFLPVLCRLAFKVEGTIFVWDARVSKFLLKSEFEFTQKEYPPHFTISYDVFGSFSPDGHFFGCIDDKCEVHVWKDSPIGYTLHQKYMVNPTAMPGLLIFSPNGKSVIMSIGNTLQLWSTKDEIIPSSLLYLHSIYISAFSPNKTFVALTILGEGIVTILNLQSGHLQMAIDTGMKIGCLGVTESMVIVADPEKIVTWSIPVGNSTSNIRANISDSTKTIMLNHSASPYNEKRQMWHMLMSLTLSQVVVVAGEGLHIYLELYDVSTGEYLGGTAAPVIAQLWLTQDGCEIWETHSDPIGWKIIGDSKSGAVELEHIEPAEYSSKMFSWQSSCGYEVKNDEWVMNSSQKRLLWLPHHWRSMHASCREWSGQFLCLLHTELPEAVVLEFLE